MYHLARTLYMRSGPGDLDESEDLFRQALDQFGQIPDEWCQSFCYDYLGLIAAKRGRFDEALAQNQRSLDILLPLVGDTHAEYASSVADRGRIFAAMGERERAADCYRQAAAAFRKNRSVKRAEEVEALAAAL